MLRFNTKINLNYNTGKRKLSRDEIELYLMCVLPVLFVIVFKYIPIGGIIIAFKDFKYNLGVFGSKFVGLENFKYILTSNDFVMLLKNTLVNNFMIIVVGMVAQVLTAIMLYEIQSRIKVKVFQTFLIIPYFISWVLVGYIVYSLLNPAYGAVNSLLESVGLKTVDWYSEPKYWLPILVIVSVWKNIGKGSIVYYASMMGIDSALFEAAKIDGAKHRHLIKYIIMPELMPLIVMFFILDVGKIFNSDFGLFYFVPRNMGALYSVTDVFDTYVFRQLRFNNNICISSATSLLQSVAGFVLVLLTNTITKKIDPDKSIF